MIDDGITMCGKCGMPHHQLRPCRPVLCERCGGTGQQPEGCWNHLTRKYDRPAGVCDDCARSGTLTGEPIRGKAMELKDKSGKIIAVVSAADVNSPECDEGVWVELKADDGTRPTLCLVKPKAGEHGWYLGVYRDGFEGKACDLAVRFCEDHGPELQVRKGNDVKLVNLFDLIAKAGL